MWYDESALRQSLSGKTLYLLSHNNPKQFDTVTSPIGVGLVSCTERFGYGTFSVEAQLPKGPNLWPAFWMYAWETWPPEIDVFEAYSYNDSSYINRNLDLLRCRWYRVQSNIHLGEVSHNYNAGPENGKLKLFKKPTRHYIEYRVDWFPDVIRIWYDGQIVRTITDAAVLSQFKDKTMNVVINNGIQASYDTESLEVSTFSVRNFKYTPYE